MALDLNNIKTQFKSILDAANTTTAAYDLSTGLNTRVQTIAKVNPLKIPQYASYYPYVTAYVDTKDIEQTNINRNFKDAKFGADINLLIVGAVWEPQQSVFNEDEADEQIETLMENIEEIMRRNFTLNGTVKWCRVEKTEYHSLPIEEETHLRYGVSSLVVRVDEY